MGSELSEVCAAAYDCGGIFAGNFVKNEFCLFHWRFVWEASGQIGRETGKVSKSRKDYDRFFGKKICKEL